MYGLHTVWHLLVPELLQDQLKQYQEIHIGDYLTSSNTPGRAMKATKDGYIIGRALENWKASDGKETILVFTQLGYYSLPLLTLNESGNVLIDSSLTATDSAAIATTSAVLSDYTATSSASTKDLFASTNVSDMAKLVSSLSTRLTNVEGDVQLLKSTQLVASSSANISSGTATLTNLSVLKNTILADTVVNGKLNIGIINIDNLSGSIDAVGPLKIQQYALGTIELQGDSLEIDKNGNISIKTGKIAGNESFRGSIVLKAGQNQIKVSSPSVWDKIPVSITVTPSYNTSIWITDKSTSGFSINVDRPSIVDQPIDWLAIW